MKIIWFNMMASFVISLIGVAMPNYVWKEGFYIFILIWIVLNQINKEKSK